MTTNTTKISGEAMTDEQLKPCPFCGGAVELEQANLRGAHRWWGVVCRNTINLGGTCAVEQIPSASPEAATERWNRRAAVRGEDAANVSQEDCDARIRKWRGAFDVMHRRAMNAEANVRELVSQARAASTQPVAQTDDARDAARWRKGKEIGYFAVSDEVTLDQLLAAQPVSGGKS
jgi:hypothetical protein